jgi:predicted DsbA family dithiol-disulfide isomerase
MTASASVTDLELFVDPACPWAWLTSRWLAEVERVRPLRVTTRLFDLAEVNRGREEGRMKEAHLAGERALRCLVQARRAAGPDALARVYSALGDAHQERGQPLGELATLRNALSDAGLDADLADRAIDDQSTLDELLAEHREAVERGAFGVPTLSVDNGPAFFGPIVDVRIRGDDAGELWDRVSWLLRNDHLFEMKRERTGKAQVGRYLVAP